MLVSVMLAASAMASAVGPVPEPLALPTPRPVYADPDPAARVPIALDWRDARALAELNQRIAREPDLLGLYTARGHARGWNGDREGMEADHARAFAIAARDTAQIRHVLWSQGWACFGLGDARAAAVCWLSAAELHGGAPFWLPYTLAVALWQLGRREEAVLLWDAAVRSEPTRWGDATSVARWTRSWRKREREDARALFEAWRIGRGTPPEPQPD